MNSCVAINIISDGRIINDKGIPILFYWDGKKDVDEELKTSNQFIAFLKSRIIDKSIYTNATLAYFYFNEDKDDNWKEIYNEKTIKLQEWIPLSTLPLDYSLKYVYDINAELYKKMYNSIYSKKIPLDKAILDIYTNMKSKYKDRISKTTYMEFIRTELLKIEPKLNNSNIDYILLKTKELLKDLT